jgi:cytoskeletal protein RodZ
VPLPQLPEQRSSPSRWLIGGIAAAVVAIVGVGVAVVLAMGGSSTPTRILAAPVVTGSAPTSTTAPSPAAQAPPTSHPSTPSPSPPKVATPTTATTPRATISQQVNQQQAVENTIHQEFALISEHKFSAAYALLAPSLQTGEAGWVDSHREEGIYNVDVATSATVHSLESATASIINMRTLDGAGCKNWTGSWNLSKIDGQWRIAEANLTPGSC